VSALPARMDRLERGPEQSDASGTGDVDPQRLTAAEDRLQSLEAAASSASRRVEWLERALGDQSDTTETVRRDELVAVSNRLSDVERTATNAVAKADLDALSERIASIESTIASRSDSAAAEMPVHSDTVNGLAERIAALEARVREATGDDADLAETLKSYVTVTTFNNAMNTKVIPHVKEMVDTRVQEELAPDALRKRVEAALPSVNDKGSAGQRDETLAGEVAAVRRELTAEQEAREKLQNALQDTRRLASEAAEQVRAADKDAGDGNTAQDLARLKEARDADRRAITELRARIESAGGSAAQAADKSISDLTRRIEELETTTSRRLEETSRTVTQVRENLSAITQHVARMGENYQDLARRVERVGEAGAPSGPAQRQGPSAQAPAVPADVDSLRDALTTIIEQNRQIREQQEMLSARFDAPTRVELDTERGDDRS